MSKNNANPSSPLLVSEGWNSCVDARLIRAQEQWEETREFQKHGHALRRLFVDLEIDAVLCIEGRPTVCVKDARNLAATEIEIIRRQLWNLGATTIFVAESKNDIKVFSTLSKPSSSDDIGNSAQLSDETIQNLEAVETALRLRRLIHRVETGEIYREYKTQFDPKSAVDQTLLKNLEDARDLIYKKHSDSKTVHAFIGRFLFSCYLLDKGIVGPAYLKKTGLPEAQDMIGLLKASNNAPEALKSLFNALHRVFNGSLFGDLLDDFTIETTDVQQLQRFLMGEDQKSGQTTLFKLYDFRFIPIELISSIYEKFLGAEAKVEEEKAKTANSSSKQTGLRAKGVYYTPPRLAELVVDIATEGWDTLLDKRCLDPACGSGIFLVILFTRMAEEWRKRNPTATTKERYDGLLEIFSKNLRGIDIHPTACLVSCFSLYLAFLEQMEPKEIMELRDVLERDARKKILPIILRESEKPRPQAPHFETIRTSDFFDVTAEKEFDLVIGNPPWVSRKDAPKATQWLFSNADNPYAKDIKKNDLSQTLFPTKELACAFMWKAGLHLKKSGHVCQVLPSRVFLSNNTDRFQSAWLKTHRLEKIWLLADWSFILFPSADCPCVINRYKIREPKGTYDDFEFVTPKVTRIDPREALIPVLPEDQKILSEAGIVQAAQHGEAAAAWKKSHWGTPRDERLIDRLLQMPRLDRLTQSPPKDEANAIVNGKRAWYVGQGFQPKSPSATKLFPVFWKKTTLFLSAKSNVHNLFLQPTECKTIGNLYGDGLRRCPNPVIFQAPLLLINQACTKFLFSDFDVLFQDDFLSICVPQREEDNLLFLTAYLSSPIAQYLLFHTTANMGIERDVALLAEMLRLPFPLPQDTSNKERSQKIINDCVKRLRKLQADLQKPENFIKRDSLVETAHGEINDYVYDYFEVCEWEKLLIQDTVKIFRPSSTPGSIDSDKLSTATPSTSSEREHYANTLIKTFRGWSRGKRTLCATSTVASQIGLVLITFFINDRSKKFEEASAEDRILNVLDSIKAATSDDSGTVFRRLHGFAFYESDKVHILKPINYRHWTATAALNDADEIITRMMEDGGWGA